jgi:8-oxo-dGTP diphosphatase
MTQGDRLIACVGGLAYDDAGRLLLVQRANEPGRGLWSVPGGRVEPGEDDAAALIREMREETGLQVAPGELIGRVVRGPFAIADYRCTVVAGPLQAGDDALDARFVDRAAMAALPLVDGLLAALGEWDALPSS